jgi:hypothetical protein
MARYLSGEENVYVRVPTVPRRSRAECVERVFGAIERVVDLARLLTRQSDSASPTT